MNQAKIFGIGLSKTGTTSLATALALLGYRALHRVTDLTEIDELDAVTDELATIYPSLDARYPRSKFILTTREQRSWLKSCAHHFRRPLPEDDPSYAAVMQLYGTVEFDAEKFAAGYDRHQREVTAYFQKRPGDLLILDVCGEGGWKSLCAFLNRPVPDAPFPRENASRSWARLLRRLRRLLPATGS